MNFDLCFAMALQRMYRLTEDSLTLVKPTTVNKNYLNARCLSIMYNLHADITIPETKYNI